MLPTLHMHLYPMKPINGLSSTIDIDEYERTHLLDRYHIRVLYLVGYPPRSLRSSLVDSPSRP